MFENKIGVIGAGRIGRALILKLLEKGYPLFFDSYTNQQFPIMPNSQLEQLKEKFSFEMWVPLDEEYSAVRFCTSWATKDEDVEALIAELDNL